MNGISPLPPGLPYLNYSGVFASSYEFRTITTRSANRRRKKLFSFFSFFFFLRFVKLDERKSIIGRRRRRRRRVPRTLYYSSSSSMILYHFSLTHSLSLSHTPMTEYGIIGRHRIPSYTMCISCIREYYFLYCAACPRIIIAVRVIPARDLKAAGHRPNIPCVKKKNMHTALLYIPVNPIYSLTIYKTGNISFRRVAGGGLGKQGRLALGFVSKTLVVRTDERSKDSLTMYA